MKKLHPSLVRQLFIIVVLLFIGILIFEEIIAYLSGLLGAVTIYVLFRNWMGKLIRKGWNKSLSAFLIMFISFIGILLPITGIVALLGSKIGKAVSNSEKIVQVIQNQLHEFESHFGYSIGSQIDTSSVASWVSTNLQALAGSTFEMVISIGIMYFVLYFMLINREGLRSALNDYLPIGRHNLQLIGEESTSMVKANAIGIPLVAICQGIIALIGFWIFDIPNPFFWFAITTVGSMIPFVGTLLGIIPIVVLLLAQGQTSQAIWILAYGLIVVGSTDNIIRLFVLKRLDNVHPLITLLGVIVGVPLFGFIGLIFGPLLISLFILFVKIYRKEYGDPDEDEVKENQSEHL